jgi:deoxyribodipyrimidine photo-lyase
MRPSSTPPGSGQVNPSSHPAHPAQPSARTADKPLHRALVWLRRDLRVHDNTALHHALVRARQVWVCFVFDSDILAALPRADRRVEFLLHSAQALDQRLRELAMSAGVAQPAGLLVQHGAARQAVPALAAALGVEAVFASHDDEPYALQRDTAVRGSLAERGVAMHTMKDHVVFERREVMTLGGTAYSVFTPFKNAWLKRLQGSEGATALQAHPVETLAAALAPQPATPPAGTAMPGLASLGFEPTNLQSLRFLPGEAGGQTLLQEFLAERIDDYADTRDFPAVKGPSYLSTHLRFGTVSIRQLAREAWQRSQAGSRGAATWLSELIWRDFYHQILHHHPQVVGQAFKPEYERISWARGASAEALFKAWCQGQTGYPIVDAAMAQINQTGYMHNRLRMVVASFLTKDLGLDWRWGEAYFATHLNDFDLAANNGGWQWAASTGCDAQPYFRIFNPVSQSRKFDPQGRFIRRYLPQLASLPDDALHAPWEARPVDLAAAGIELGRDYPKPVVDHAQAREQTLARYAVVKVGRG